MDRQQGVVKFFNQEKGYGFVKSNKGGQDIFVHSKSLQPGLTLNQGDLIEFEVSKALKGDSAEAVDLIQRGFDAERSRGTDPVEHRRTGDTIRRPRRSVDG